MITKKQRNSSRQGTRNNFMAGKMVGRRPMRNLTNHHVTTETLVNAYGYSKTFAERVVAYAQENGLNLQYKFRWEASPSIRHYTTVTRGRKESAENLRKAVESGKLNGFVHGKEGFFFWLGGKSLAPGSAN